MTARHWEASTMRHTPVSSSDIASVGYDAQSATLEIHFHSGGTYQYFDVPQSIYDGLMAAGSHGTYFHAHIRERYRYQKVG
jgi:hypothetical protein